VHEPVRADNIATENVADALVTKATPKVGIWGPNVLMMSLDNPPHAANKVRARQESVPASNDGSHPA